MVDLGDGLRQREGLEMTLDHRLRQGGVLAPVGGEGVPASQEFAQHQRAGEDVGAFPGHLAAQVLGGQIAGGADVADPLAVPGGLPVGKDRPVEIDQLEVVAAGGMGIGQQ